MFFLILCFCLISAATVHAQDPVNIECIGQFSQVMESVRGVDIVGDQAFIWGHSLTVLDILDQSRPSPVMNVPLDYSNIIQFEADPEAGVAFISSYDGFKILDIAAPGEGEFIAQIDFDRGNSTFDKVGENVYFITNDSFRIIDVSDLENPVITGSCDLDFGSAVSISVVGDYAYVVENDNNNNNSRGRLVVIDITEPENTRIITRREHDNMQMGLIDEAGDHLCILAQNNLLMVDIENPRDPQFVSETDISGRDLEVDQQNEIIFARSIYAQEILLVSYEDPDHPRIKDTIDVATEIYPDYSVGGIDFLNGNLYITTQIREFSFQTPGRDMVDMFGSLEIFNVEDPEDIALSGRYVMRTPQAINFNDNIAYVSQYDYLSGSALSIWDISNVDTFEYLQSYYFPDLRTSSLIFEDYLLMFGDSIYVYDISQPGNLVEVASYFTDHQNWIPKSLHVTDGMAFICGSMIDDPIYFARVFDIMDPENVTELWNFESSSFIQKIYPVGDFMICVERATGRSENVVLYNIEDPGDIIALDTLSIGYQFAFGCELHDNMLYFGSDSLYVIEINENNELALSAVMDCRDEVEHIRIVDDLLFLTGKWEAGGLFVYNIAEPGEAREVGSYPDDTFHSNLYVHDNAIYVLYEYDVKLFQFHNPDLIESEPASPQKFGLLAAWPNPFNSTTTLSYTLNNRTNVALNIYNTSGQLVDVILEGVMPAGTHQIVLNGGDLSSGVYLVKMVAGNSPINYSTEKVILMR